jgi:hypothetical protein
LRYSHFSELDKRRFEETLLCEIDENSSRINTPGERKEFKRSFHFELRVSDLMTSVNGWNEE